MQFEYVPLSDKRKEEIKNMRIKNTYDDTVYETFNFGVAASIDQRYVLFGMTSTVEDTVRKYIFVRGDEYSIVNISKSDIDRQVFIHDYHGEYYGDNDEKKSKHIYEQIRIQESAIDVDSDKFIRALAVYNRERRYYMDIIKSIIYYGDELKIKEFMYDKDGAVIDVIFERGELSQERCEEIDELNIPYPYSYPGMPTINLSDSYVIKSEDEKYVLEKIRVYPLMTREVDYKADGPDFCFLSGKKHYWITDKSLGSCLVNKYSPRIENTMIEINSVEGLSEYDVRVLAYAVMKYYSWGNERKVGCDKYDNWRINLYYDGEIMLKGF